MRPLVPSDRKRPPTGTPHWIAAVPAGLVDRLYRAVPLASAFLWLCVLYGWQTRGHVTPWLFTDELKLTQLSRSIAETGHAAQRGQPASFQTLYAYVIAPWWRIGDVGTAYAAIKYAGVVVMASAIFPAYFLARMIVSRPWALFAAVGAVAIPSIAYAPFLVEEPAAYPWATLCFFLIAKALVARSARWVLGAAAAVLVAPLVRGQLAVLIPVYVALARSSWPGRAPARGAGEARGRPGTGPGAAVLGIGAVILFSAVVGAHSRHLVHRHRLLPASNDRLRAVGGRRVRDRARAPARGRARGARQAARRAVDAAS